VRVCASKYMYFIRACGYAAIVLPASQALRLYSLMPSYLAQVIHTVSGTSLCSSTRHSRTASKKVFQPVAVLAAHT
jgi:hypothetical protein